MEITIVSFLLNHAACFCACVVACPGDVFLTFFFLVQNPNGFLRARACWMYQQFSSFKFVDEQSFALAVQVLSRMCMKVRLCMSVYDDDN